MRWGIAIVLSPLVASTVLAACDGLQSEPSQRYYIAPDADDGELVDGAIVQSDGAIIVPVNDAAIPTDGPAPIDPATLGLSAWWRASYAVGAWPGTASAGGSATAALAQVGTAPAVGPPLGAFPTVDFDGADDHLLGPLMSTLQSTTNLSGWALVDIEVIHTDSVAFSGDDHIVGTAGTGLYGIYLRDNGAGTTTVGFRVSAGADRTVSTPFVKNVWQLVQWRANGVTIEIRVNGGAWASAPGGTIDSLAAAIDVGRDPNQDRYLDGKIAEIALAPIRLSDDEFEKVRSYARARYGAAL